MANAKIAAVRGAESAVVQTLFEEATARWRASGVRVAGLIEETHGLEGRTCTAGVLRDIVSGERQSIFLETLPQGATCHIDATGAESACAMLLKQIKSCDLVILSKFGKLEAAHGGLIGAFEAAVAEGKPVLTTVSDKHIESWHEFAPGAAVLPAKTEAIEEWWTSLHTGNGARVVENPAD
jgi:nucleoside-triphosphatase THEP1